MNEASPAPRTPGRGVKSIDILQFLNLGYKDYLAARVLLNSGLPTQGAILASTAIEKYFKALITFRGNNATGHLRQAHVESIRNFDPGLYELFSPSFLAFLQKCYKLRYMEVIGPGFNIAIFAREVLAELDYTVSLLNARFRINRGDKASLTAYDSGVTGRDPRLFQENHVLQHIEKTAFLLQNIDYVCEYRFSTSGTFIELFYTSKTSLTDGNFMREALEEAPPGRYRTTGNPLEDLGNKRGKA